MRFQRRKKSTAATWVIVAGVVLTGAAAAYAFKRLMGSEGMARLRSMRGLEKRVLQALLNDEIARTEGIDIAALGGGIIELSGMVESRENARHVIELVDSLPGVHAVVNRMEVRSVESQLERNRKQFTGTERTRWFGGSVGIGKRRQSFDTDPHRRDDHIDLLSRSLQPNRDDTLTDVEEMEASGVRIGVSNSSGFATGVSPHSPDPAEDAPSAPPEIAPHDAAKRE